MTEPEETKQKKFTDIDLEIKLRSSKVKLGQLLEIIHFLSENLSKIGVNVVLVEQNMNSTETHGKNLVSVSSKFQTPE